MKKIRIDWNGSHSPIVSVYENNGIKFSWLAPGKTAEELSQVTGWHSCRETFTGEICKFVANKQSSAWSYKRDLDFKKTRVAVVRRHKRLTFIDGGTRTDLKWMRCAARLLNIFEKSQGWALTHVSMCDDLDLHKNSINVFAFSSSAKWQQAPQLLSLYLLIIRLGAYWKEFAGFKKVDDLKSMSDIFSKNPSLKIQTDPIWLIDTWKYWMLLLNNHDALFFKKSLEENYRENGGAHGIKYLLRGVADQDILKTWKEVAVAVK